MPSWGGPRQPSLSRGATAPGTAQAWRPGLGGWGVIGDTALIGQFGGLRANPPDERPDKAPQSTTLPHTTKPIGPPTPTLGGGHPAVCKGVLAPWQEAGNPTLVR